VAVFAGGFTFGTLISLPTTLDNFDYISTLLSFAFILFSTSLFLAIFIQYLLRRHHADELLLYNMWLASQIHTALVIVLLMSGFVLLDIILINIGHKAAGTVGLALLPMIPIWYFAVSYAERTGRLPRARPDGRELRMKLERGSLKIERETRIMEQEVD